jgi:hypothetical protein
MKQGDSDWLKAYLQRLWRRFGQKLRQPSSRQIRRSNNPQNSTRPFETTQTNILTQNLTGNSNIAIGQNVGVVNYYAHSHPSDSRTIRTFNAPPLPYSYVQRTQLLGELKEQLFSNKDTLVIRSICGMGGIGKTVLAAAIARDNEVREHFQDGILWISLGQNPNLLQWLIFLINKLEGFERPTPKTIKSASLELKTLLIGRKILLIVDDIWNSDHTAPFIVGDAGCCVLFTTREARIPKANYYDLDVMRPDQALELLKNRVSHEPSNSDLAIAEKITKAVGYLPLALELVASQVNEECIPVLQ